MSARNKRRGSFPALPLCAAMAPLMSRCAGAGWLSAGLGAGGAALLLHRLYALSPAGHERQKDTPSSAVLRIIAGAMLLLLAARAAISGTHAFARTAGDPTAACLLLALSLWAASGGPRPAARCAGILLRLVLVFFLIVTVFSLPQLRFAWLQPRVRPDRILSCFGLLLVPGAALWLREEKGNGSALWLLSPLAASSAAITGGVLSPALAAKENSFLTLARSVSVLGVMRRFEALVSGAMLPAWFCLCTLLLCAARDAVPMPKNTRPYLIETAEAGSCFLLLPVAMRLNLTTVAVISAISCGLIPLILLSVDHKKIFRNFEKKC